MMRPQITVTIQWDGDMLQAYIAALLEPLVPTCDIYIRSTGWQQPLLGVNPPPEAEST